MKSLEEILSELAASADAAILSPTTEKRLRDQGIHIPKPPKLTLEESINLLFSERRKEKALEIARKLPEPPDVPVSSIQSLYNEIREAIILGLYGAAITLSGILIEYALKYSAYKVEMGGFAKYDAEKWDEFEKIELFKAIERADKNNLLNEEIKKSLNEFRVRYRNPYNHYNIKKITAPYYAKDMPILNTQTKEVEIRDVAAKDNPIVALPEK